VAQREIPGGYTNEPKRLARAIEAGRQGRLLYITDKDGVLDGQGALWVAATRTTSAVLSARRIGSLQFDYGAIPRLQLVGSMGRTVADGRGPVRTDPDAIATRPLVKTLIPLVRDRLQDAHLIVPRMTQWDPDWDGFGMALYMRGINDHIAGLRGDEKRIGANFDPSGVRARLDDAEAEREALIMTTEAIFRSTAAEFGNRLVLEYGHGMIGLMGARGDGSPFTKGDAVRDLFNRTVAAGDAPVAVLYIGDEGGVDGRDSSAWNSVRELERSGLIDVGLTVGVDSDQVDNLSSADRSELDVVLTGVPAVAAFTLGVTGDGFGQELAGPTAQPVLGG
jgi:hypothetical protein